VKYISPSEMLLPYHYLYHTAGLSITSWPSMSLIGPDLAPLPSCQNLLRPVHFTLMK